MLLLFGLECYSQKINGIPADKYEFWRKDFIEDCRKSTAKLPYNIHIQGYWQVDMKKIDLFNETAFILDGDTSLLYYMTKPVYDYYMDADSLVLVQGSYRTTFDFKAIGCFDYKDYVVVVYTFPLANPNFYQCCTINTYSKKGKRIDRMPFFMWRFDFDILDIGENLDASWLEMTGYIDESFEITICQRTPWNIIHDEHGFRKEGLDEDVYNNLHTSIEYHVYNISDDGHFVEVQKPHKYEADERNNWTPIK